jgi:uncharacterized protein
MQSLYNQPVSSAQRAEVLDILRGIALLGICIANYPMFSLYIFQTPEVWAAMPTAAIDQGIAYFHFIFVDGKFYSLFSLLFGIGFSIILLRSEQAGKNGLTIFYRRLFILLCIGLAHIFLLWEGDILLLYALLGMSLPLFRNVSDRKLLIIFAALILSPLLFDVLKVATNNAWNISLGAEEKAEKLDTFYGITEDNFGAWQAVHTRYIDMFHYNQSAFFWRWHHLLDSNRLPKVLGMFLLGLYAGRKLIYKNLQENVNLFKKVQRWGFIVGLPASVLYAYLELDTVSLPKPFALLDTFFYAISVVPMSLAYTATICLLYLNPTYLKNLKIFAAPGRMALTNYLLQTLFGILIFYGVGFGLGATMGLTYVIIIAFAVYLFEVLFSHLWLSYFQYGPMEWMWRQLTYGKRLYIKKQTDRQEQIA